MRGAERGRGLRLAAFVAASVLASLPGVGAAADPALDLEVRSTGATVGDRVQVRVVARGGDGCLWGDPQVEIDPGGDWELVAPPRPVPESSPPAWEMTLAPMAVGELVLPPILVSIRSEDSGPQLVQAADPPSLTVASVLPPEEDVAPAPIRDPLGVGGFPWEWAPPVLAAGLPLALLAVWWLRRRRRRLGGREEARPVPPLEELEGAMAEIRARVGKDPITGLCDGLAGSLRRFLERRTGEAALEMTSVELRLLSRRREWPQPTQGDIQRVMALADGVRFGRQAVAESEVQEAAQSCVEAGRGLDKELRTREEAAAEAARGGGS